MIPSSTYKGRICALFGFKMLLKIFSLLFHHSSRHSTVKTLPVVWQVFIAADLGKRKPTMKC